MNTRVASRNPHDKGQQTSQLFGRKQHTSAVLAGLLKNNLSLGSLIPRGYCTAAGCLIQHGTRQHIFLSLFVGQWTLRVAPDKALYYCHCPYPSPRKAGEVADTLVLWCVLLYITATNIRSWFDGWFQVNPNTPDLPQKQPLVFYCKEKSHIFSRRRVFPSFYGRPARTTTHEKREFSTQLIYHPSTMYTANRDKSNPTDAQRFRRNQRVRTNDAQGYLTSRTLPTNHLSTREDAPAMPPTKQPSSTKQPRRAAGATRGRPTTPLLLCMSLKLPEGTVGTRHTVFCERRDDVSNLQDVPPYVRKPALDAARDGLGVIIDS